MGKSSCTSSSCKFNDGLYSSDWVFKRKNLKVTTAVFAPKPQLILNWIIEQQKKQSSNVSFNATESAVTPQSTRRNTQGIDNNNINNQRC